jgi:hypothetical protein
MLQNDPDTFVFGAGPTILRPLVGIQATRLPDHSIAGSDRR